MVLCPSVTFLLIRKTLRYTVKSSHRAFVVQKLKSSEDKHSLLIPKMIINQFFSILTLHSQLSKVDRKLNPKNVPRVSITTRMFMSFSCESVDKDFISIRDIP